MVSSGFSLTLLATGEFFIVFSFLASFLLSIQHTNHLISSEEDLYGKEEASV
jgi:hypothetical protein